MRTTRMVQALLLAVVASMTIVRPAVGQTRIFEAPDTVVDVSAYTSVHECMAAVARVKENVEAREIRTIGIWPDTMPYDREDAWRPVPPAVEATARICLEATARDVASVPIEGSWERLAQLYLYAGWEDSARAVVERRLAAVEPDSATELMDILTRTLYLFNAGDANDPLNIQPPRPDLGDDIVLEHVGKLKDVRSRMQVYKNMVGIGAVDPAEDSEAGARTRRNMIRIRAQLDSLTQRELQLLVDEGHDVSMRPEELGDQLEALFTFLFVQQPFLDSLRVSTAAYVSFKRETFSRGTGQPPEAYLHGRPLGERAPTLEGDVWLGCQQEPCEQYPREGRVSLVLMRPRIWMYDESTFPGLFGPGGTCPVPVHGLRRLQNRFPDLDIIVVTHTIERFMYVKEDITPEQEAQLFRKCLDSHGLERVVLTMAETPGWRLPDPDGRRVDQPTTNWTNYSFGGTWSEADRVQNGRALLIDQDGYIVHTGNVDRWGERDFAEMIEILLEREGSAR